MSRSYKKSPAWSWTTYLSDKKDKRYANRSLRHRNKQIIRSCGERMYFNEDNDDWEFSAAQLCASDFKIIREVSDTWAFDSDGLAYYHGIPDWRDDIDFRDDTKDDFLNRVRNRSTLMSKGYNGRYSKGMFVEGTAKWYHYRWKMK